MFFYSHKLAGAESLTSHYDYPVCSQAQPIPAPISSSFAKLSEHVQDAACNSVQSQHLP